MATTQPSPHTPTPIALRVAIKSNTKKTSPEQFILPTELQPIYIHHPQEFRQSSRNQNSQNASLLFHRSHAKISVSCSLLNSSNGRLLNRYPYTPSPSLDQQQQQQHLFVLIGLQRMSLRTYVQHRINHMQSLTTCTTTTAAAAATMNQHMQVDETVLSEVEQLWSQVSKSVKDENKTLFRDVPQHFQYHDRLHLVIPVHDLQNLSAQNPLCFDLGLNHGKEDQGFAAGDEPCYRFVAHVYASNHRHAPLASATSADWLVLLPRGKVDDMLKRLCKNFGLPLRGVASIGDTNSEGDDGSRNGTNRTGESVPPSSSSSSRETAQISDSPSPLPSLSFSDGDMNDMLISEDFEDPLDCLLDHMHQQLQRENEVLKRQLELTTNQVRAHIEDRQRGEEVYLQQIFMLQWQLESANQVVEQQKTEIQSLKKTVAYYEMLSNDGLQSQIATTFSHDQQHISNPYSFLGIENQLLSEDYGIDQRDEMFDILMGAGDNNYGDDSHYEIEEEEEEEEEKEEDEAVDMMQQTEMMSRQSSQFRRALHPVNKPMGVKKKKTVKKRKHLNRPRSPPSLLSSMVAPPPPPSGALSISSSSFPAPPPPPSGALSISSSSFPAPPPPPSQVSSSPSPASAPAPPPYDHPSTSTQMEEMARSRQEDGSLEKKKRLPKKGFMGSMLSSGADIITSIKGKFLPKESPILQSRAGPVSREDSMNRKLSDLKISEGLRETTSNESEDNGIHNNSVSIQDFLAKCVTIAARKKGDTFPSEQFYIGDVVEISVEYIRPDDQHKPAQPLEVSVRVLDWPDPDVQYLRFGRITQNDPDDVSLDLDFDSGRLFHELLPGTVLHEDLITCDNNMKSTQHQIRLVMTIVDKQNNVSILVTRHFKVNPK